MKRHVLLIGRAAGRGAFKAAALVGAFAIIVATWWWDASLLTAAADANLQLIKIITSKYALAVARFPVIVMAILLTI